MTLFQRWLITLAVMTATLMQVLDTTIVNVALPHMQGNLGATSDQISWVLTSYLISSAIMMPLTGYLSDRFGQRNYLLVSIFGFVLTSALCGAAQTLNQIVLFRFLQGVFGASLVPLSQTIMTTIFPENERGKAMAIWGTGVMVGPILGPTLGGYLTSIATWRWNFYVNLPIGIIALLIAWQALPDTERKNRSMDWLGLLLISTAIGALQFVLDRGNQSDWFDSMSIRIGIVLTVIGLGGFILHSLQSQKSVFDIRIFKDKNFTIAAVILALFGLGLYGSMVILPIMLENLLHYPVLITGLIMAPRGISAMISMIIMGKMTSYIDPKILIGLGIMVSVSGMWMCTYYSINLSWFWLIFPLVLQGIGLGMIFIPLSIVAFSTLPASTRAEAAGLFSLLRILGSSIGVSITVTLFTRYTQVAWNQMGGYINPYNASVNAYLHNAHLNLHQPAGVVVLTRELSRQAQMLSFINVFAFISISFLMMLPLVLLLKKNQQAHDIHVALE